MTSSPGNNNKSKNVSAKTNPQSAASQNVRKPLWSDAEDSDDEPMGGNNNAQKATNYNFPPATKSTVVNDIKSYTPIALQDQAPLEPREECEWTFSWDGWEKVIKTPTKESPTPEESVENKPSTDTENNDGDGEEDLIDALGLAVEASSNTILTDTTEISLPPTQRPSISITFPRECSLSEIPMLKEIRGQDTCKPGKPAKLTQEKLKLHYILHYMFRGTWNDIVPEDNPEDLGRMETYRCNFCNKEYKNNSSKKVYTARGSILCHLAIDHGKLLEAMKTDTEVNMNSDIDLINQYDDGQFCKLQPIDHQSMSKDNMVTIQEIGHGANDSKSNATTENDSEKKKDIKNLSGYGDRKEQPTSASPSVPLGLVKRGRGRPAKDSYSQYTHPQNTNNRVDNNNKIKKDENIRTTGQNNTELQQQNYRKRQHSSSDEDSKRNLGTTANNQYRNSNKKLAFDDSDDD